MDSKKRCPNCGSSQDINSSKCLNCGYALIKEEKAIAQTSKAAKVLSIIAVCCAILSIASCINVYAGIFLCVTALICVAVAKSQNGGEHTSLSKKAFIIAVIGGSLTVLVRIIVLIIQIAGVMTDLQNYL